MPAKFFQKIEKSSGLTEISKVEVDDSLKVLELVDKNFHESHMKVLRTKDFFSKDGWVGFKITLEDGKYIFCSSNCIFLSASADLLRVTEIRPKQELLGPAGKLVVSKIETGKVLCGQKFIYLQEKANQKLFIHVNGLWLAETATEEKLSVPQKENNPKEKYIFPKNPVVRAIKKALFSLSS